MVKFQEEEKFVKITPQFKMGLYETSISLQGIQQKQGNLRSEGLCLVPVTFTQKIAINNDINMIQPHNFN